MRFRRAMLGERPERPAHEGYGGNCGGLVRLEKRRGVSGGFLLAAARGLPFGEKERRDAVAIYLFNDLSVITRLEDVEDSDGFREGEPGRKESMVMGLLRRARVEDEWEGRLENESVGQVVRDRDMENGRCGGEFRKMEEEAV